VSAFMSISKAQRLALQYKNAEAFKHLVPTVKKEVHRNISLSMLL